MVPEHFHSQIFKRTDVEHLVLLLTGRYTHRALTPLMRSYEILGDPGEGAGKAPRATLLVTTLMARPFPEADRALLEICSLIDPQDESAATTLNGPSADRIRRRLTSSPLASREGTGWTLKAPEPAQQEDD